MTNRIAIPVSHNLGQDSPIAGHFGKAKYFAIVSDADTSFIENTSSKFGGQLSPPDFLMSHKIDVVISRKMGGPALQKLQSGGVQVYRMDDKRSISEIMDKYRQNGLEKMTEGHSHNHHLHNL